MTYLNRIFGSVESIAKNELEDGVIILKKWADYLETIPEKKEIIAKLPFAFGKRKAMLRKLKKLLELEIVDIQIAKNEEDDLIKNLESLEHSKRMKQIERLAACLAYIESKDEYAYKLLRHLYVNLKSEWRLVAKLEKNNNIRKYRKWVGILTSELNIERSALNQMYDIPVFHDTFLALVKREKVITLLDDKEKRLLRIMQKRMDKIFSGKISTEITYVWATAVFNAIKIKVQKAYDKGILDGHPDVDFQFVNRPEFVDLVRQTIRKLKKMKVSEQMINVFVHIFREWFNYK